jgi:ATP-dependent DNA ligase
MRRKKLNLRSTILDGEIVALDDEGIPRFQLLQKWQNVQLGRLIYFGIEGPT